MTLEKYSNSFDRPSKILKSITFYSFGDGDPLSHLRVLGPARQMGIKVIKGIEKDTVIVDRVSDGDVVVLQRDFPRNLDSYEKVLKLAHELGKPVILDIDDLLFELPESHPDRLSNAYLEALFPLFQALMEVDLVTVSTTALCNIFLPYNKNIIVLPNYLDDHLWHLKPPASSSAQDETVIIGYMGSYTHQPDVVGILPILLDLLERYPTRLQLHFWGVRPPDDLASMGQVHWHVMNTPTYAHFAKIFQSQVADIFVAPLLENSFNICKSSVKYLEYSALGIPGVYSNLDPYSSVIHHGQNGFLASSPKEWEDCLVQLIENRELRLSMAAKAQENVSSTWLLSQNALKWSDAYQKALTIRDLNVLLAEKEPFLRLFKSLTQQMVGFSHQNGKYQNEVLAAELVEIKGSRAWKLAMLLHRIRSVIEPIDNTPGGWIRKLIYLLVFPIKKVQRARLLRRNSALVQTSGLFDSAWYLAKNPDVNQLGLDPVNHYLQFGGFEGRDPGPLFSSSWYLNQYEDVQVSGENPLVHYLRHGKAENRMVKPNQILYGETGNRNMQDQSFQFIRALLRSMNLRRVKKAFGFFIQGDFKAIKRSVLLTSLNNDLGLVDVTEMELAECASLFRSKIVNEHIVEKLNQEIDIIVPIFNGMEFLPPLFDSLYKNTNVPFRVIVIDDHSPDPAVRPFLEDLAEQHANMRVYFNEKNIGFVKTINIASTYTQNHFVILNTDVEVPEAWLQRLMKPIIDNPKIASTTPFTNSGTICSFPKALVDNPIFAGLDVNAVDSVFKQVDAGSVSIEMPTGVGFCMGINWDVWKNIGSFDEDRFGKGYGEENDWCMRAISAGFLNLMVPNLFVYHKHGGSFPSQEKQKLMKENWEKLIGLHPGYPSLVQKFIAADAPKPLRKFASLILMSASSIKKPILIVDHQIGGGANQYREKVVEDCLQSDQAVFILTYDLTWRAMKLQVLYREYSETFKVEHPKDLLILGDFIQLSEIVYNNVVTYADPLSVLSVILQLKQVFKARLKVLIHDHYALCPSYTLLNYKGVFCDLPAVDVCKVCLPRNVNRIPADENYPASILKWRRGWSDLLKEADEIVCFSKSSQDLLQRIYSLKNEQISIQPHNFISPFNKKPRVNLQAPLCIGVIGTINYHKGSQMILDVAKILAVKHPQIKIVVVGNLEISNQLPNLTVVGEYKQLELPDLIEKHGINMCFFSSIIPETFSYVTSELLDLEMPVCSFNIGAPAERIGQYKFGHLISAIDAETAVEEIVNFYDQLIATDSIVVL